jgi:hypothetical protein
LNGKVDNQNKSLQASIADVKKNAGNPGGVSDITTSTIQNADTITTKKITVTDTDAGVDGLTVNGDTNLQGPVKVGNDLSVGGSLNVIGSVTAASFVGDGSRLTGVQGAQGAQGIQGATGAQGPRGFTGNTGAAGTPANCVTCVTLQNTRGTSEGADTNAINILGSAYLASRDGVNPGSSAVAIGFAPGDTLTTGDILDVRGNSFLSGQLRAGNSIGIGSMGSVVGALDVRGGDLNVGHVGDSNSNFNSVSNLNVIDGDITVTDGDTGTAGGGNITAKAYLVNPTGSSAIAGSTVTCAGGETLNGIVVTGGIVTGGTCAANGADYAERFASTQSLSAGEVVAIDSNNPENVVRTTSANQASAIGIVSTQPGQTVGTGNVVVALAGRVPVKVTGQNGPIFPGDYLTSSSTPGYAMKAMAGQKTIGQAMDSFTGSTGTVLAFVNISDGGNVAAQNQVQPAQSGSFSDLNVSGTANIQSLTVSGVATINTLEVTGTATVANLIVNGHITGNADTRGTVTIAAGSTSAHKTFGAAYSSAPVVVASPVTSSVAFHVSSNASGFSIIIDSPAAADIEFNYLVQQ